MGVWLSQESLFPSGKTDRAESQTQFGGTQINPSANAGDRAYQSRELYPTDGGVKTPAKKCIDTFQHFRYPLTRRGSYSKVCGVGI